jgi:hypothetical protein
MGIWFFKGGVDLGAQALFACTVSPQNTGVRTCSPTSPGGRRTIVVGLQDLTLLVSRWVVADVDAHMERFFSVFRHCSIIAPLLNSGSWAHYTVRDRT